MTMLEFSDEESRINSASSDSESEINIRSSRNRQKTLLDEIKENPDLYATRRSERHRKEPTRLNIQTDKSKLRRLYSESSSLDNDANDSDYIYSKRKKRYSYKPKMEFRKRGHVSYKEAESSDGRESDDSSQPQRKSQKNSSNVQTSSMRDNPLVNRPSNLIRKIDGDLNENIQESFELINTDQDDVNIIEEVLNYRVGHVGNTGHSTTFYNQKLRENNRGGGENNLEEGEIKENGEAKEKERQYLIKWRGWSHIHSTWESENSLKYYSNLDGMKKVYKFKDTQKQRDYWKKHEASPEDLDAAQFEEERNEFLLQQKMECERIIDSCRSTINNKHNNSIVDGIDYLIKWRTLDYRYSTWESGDEIVRVLFPVAIDEYEERSHSDKIPNRKCEVWTRRPKFIPMREQPEYLSNAYSASGSELNLRDYQLDGVNWLARAWTRGNSVILADEMGLGKTIQTIGFFAYLFNQHQMYGPFLLVVPLSTISSWQTELNIWAPYMNVVIYTGDSVSRQVIRECEWYFPKKKMLKFHVCITTYELLLKDKAWLNQISWASLGVDEAHRLKNDESQLYSALISFNTNTRLLITGTPVHNSLRELWALLHFIMPDRFDRWQDFEDKYNISEENGHVGEIMQNLYKVLEPFLLRRTKKDVEKSLPSKSEQIIRVPMCKKQADFYKLILTKNYEALSKETRGHTSSFLNVVMELKKCCNHVQLVNPLDEETEQMMDAENRLRYIIKSSGKMMLLDKLLFEMRDNGHRVLIFSQMVRMLDIISDYLILRGWGFQRLDGSIKGSLRKQAIDHFNAEGSTDFCFLLSTRAGGLGINLATADTVVIFDSDWNPQNDLQAMARAHRIGQTKQVSVYRFVIKSSVEEKIIECAKRKMVLDHLVIQRMDSALHRKTDANKNQPFNKDELNEILKFGAADLFNQDESMDEEHELNIHDILQRAETRDNDEEVHNPANELLSAFKVVNITETPEDEDIVYIGHKGKPKLWSEIVPQELRDKVKEEEHQKTLIDLELGPRQRKKVKTYQVGKTDESSDESSDEEIRVGIKLNEKEIRSIVRVMKKFSRPQERIQSLIIEAEILDRSEMDVQDMVNRIIEGCQIVLRECDTDEKRNKAILNIGRISIPAKSFLQSIDDLDILYQILPKDRDLRLKFKMPFETKLANWSCIWGVDDDSRLLVGVYEKGMDNWEAIKMDPDLNLSTKILPSSTTDRPQASHLKTRVEYLVKRLREYQKKVGLIQANNLKSNKLLKVDKKKVNKTKLKPTPNNVKSAEYVQDSDSSKESGHNKSKQKVKSKSLKQKVTLDKIKSKDVKDVSRIDNVVYSEADEASFYEMRGPLFDKCTRKMKPIKGELKFLEDMQKKYRNKIQSDDRKLSECLLSIGNHIRTIIIDFNNDEEKRKWRNYLWSFVNFFFDVFPKENLHRIYKNAFKKSSETKKGKNDLKHKDDSKRNNSTYQKHGHDDKNFEKPKCDFEAKSYQEYRIKMKNYKGESSREPHNEKPKPYDRPPSYDHNKKHEYKSHKYFKSQRSDYENHHSKSNNTYSSHDDSQDSYHKFPKSDTKSSRDPRLSKPTIN